jgi:hypothetical protein
VPGVGPYFAAVTFNPADATDYNAVPGGSVRVNRHPVANPNAGGMKQGQALSINVVKLLYNDTDADSNTLSVAGAVSPSTHGGTVTLASGAVTYTNADFTGTDTFVYVVSDGYGGTAQGTVTVTVTPLASGPKSLNIVYGPTVSGSDFVIRFAGIPGYTYTVEYADSLTPPINWQKKTNLTAPTTAGAFGIGVFEFRESTGGATTRFYRTVWPSY